MIKSRIAELNNEQYKSKLRCHAKSYRKKLVVYSDKIREHFYNEEIPKDKKILGHYRHMLTFCNYDEICRNITHKWEIEQPAFCSDLIHSVSSKVNDLILEALLLGKIKPTLQNEKTF